MRSALTFLAVLVVGLGLLTLGAQSLFSSKTRSWFERDVELRDDLILKTTRGRFADQLRRSDTHELQELAESIAIDERIMATAVCSRS